jgi:hypothetical protein
MKSETTVLRLYVEFWFATRFRFSVPVFFPDALKLLGRRIQSLQNFLFVAAVSQIESGIFSKSIFEIFTSSAFKFSKQPFQILL